MFEFPALSNRITTTRMQQIRPLHSIAATLTEEAGSAAILPHDLTVLRSAFLDSMQRHYSISATDGRRTG
jgi:hypothetical protein